MTRVRCGGWSIQDLAIVSKSYPDSWLSSNGFYNRFKAFKTCDLSNKNPIDWESLGVAPFGIGANRRTRIGDRIPTKKSSQAVGGGVAKVTFWLTSPDPRATKRWDTPADEATAGAVFDINEKESSFGCLMTASLLALPPIDFKPSMSIGKHGKQVPLTNCFQ